MAGSRPIYATVRSLSMWLRRQCKYMPKQAAIIIAQKDFRDDELRDIKAILDSRKIVTSVIAKTRNKAVGKFGMEVKPDLAIAEIEEPKFDALIFIGGTGCRQYIDDEIVLKLINDFKNSKKVLSGSCLAPSILASAGVLISKRVTAFPTEEENLKNKGAEYTGMQIEVDGNIVTSKDPSDAEKFASAIAYLLEG